MQSTPGRAKLGVTDIRYMKPRDNAKLEAHLKYLTYREDRSGPPLDVHTRWHDQGLGNDWPTVKDGCHTHRGPHVLSWDWAIAPNPYLLSLIPDEARQTAMCEIAERTLDQYYEARGLMPPPYSYVVHNALTKANEAHPDPVPFTHAHVIVSGTTLDLLSGQIMPTYNNKEEGDIQLMHDVTNANVERILDQELGLKRGIDWRAIAEAEFALAERTKIPEIVLDETELAGTPTIEKRTAIIAQDEPTLSFERPNPLELATRMTDDEFGVEDDIEDDVFDMDDDVNYDPDLDIEGEDWYTDD